MNKNNNYSNSLVELEPQMRAELEAGKLVEFETHGFSMIPLLHDGGDRVVLEKPHGKLELDDVVLCKTTLDKYVLHRVVGFEGNGYATKGDNCLIGEYCRCDADVIGKAVGFVRKGKYVDVNSDSYKFYVKHVYFFVNLWRKFWRIADFFVRLRRK